MSFGKYSCLGSQPHIVSEGLSHLQGKERFGENGDQFVRPMLPPEYKWRDSAYFQICFMLADCELVMGIYIKCFFKIWDVTIFKMQ